VAATTLPYCFLHVSDRILEFLFSGMNAVGVIVSLPPSFSFFPFLLDFLFMLLFVPTDEVGSNLVNRLPSRMSGSCLAVEWILLISLFL